MEMRLRKRIKSERILGSAICSITLNLSTQAMPKSSTKRSYMFLVFAVLCYRRKTILSAYTFFFRDLPILATSTAYFQKKIAAQNVPHELENWCRFTRRKE